MLVTLAKTAVASLLVVAFGLSGVGAVPGRPDRTQIVFGYMQSVGANGPLSSYRWHALTHVGYTWVAFRADGSLHPDSVQAFNARSPELLRGGAAANNGVRVIAVLCNLKFNREIIDAVFTSREKRTRLVNETVKLVTDPAAGCEGISLDVEPMNFSPATAAGYDQFLIALADALHRLTPRREISMYVGKYYPGRYSLKTFRDRLDYILFSAYNFTRDNVVGDVGLIDGIHTGIDSWLRAGLPPEKVVLAAATFGKQWEVPTPAWGAKGKTLRSIGMDYGNSLLSRRQPPLAARASGPNRSCVWTSEPGPKAGSYIINSFDDMPAHERKLRMALAWDGEVQKGRSLGGVGFWSLMWLAQGLQPGSVDPNDPTGSVNPSLRRTYSAPWTLWEEMFSPAAITLFRAETFEGAALDPLWVAPAKGPDAQNVEYASVTSVPVAGGALVGSHRAAALQFAFSAGPGRLIWKYRPLADTRAPHPIDRNAFLVLTATNAEFTASAFLREPVPNTTLRIVICDAKNQLERSRAFPLDKSGWQQFRLKLADRAAVEPCPTRERGFQSGNGIVDTEGQRDVGLIGFELESASASQGRIELDQILYSLGAP